jgi:hypothetical protein
MEPEAQLIAAQAAEELARQQATGQVDELQRGRMAQQILQGAGQQAQAREAQQRQAEFARRKRLGDIVAAGEAEKRLGEYRKKTQDIGGMFQAGLGAASALAGQGASYLAEQSALAEGLKAAEAKGGVQGAIDFLNANPNYDPGEETLQRLYAGSEMGQQDAAVDTALAALIKQADIAEIQNRNRQRAVKALNRQADEFMAGSRGPTSYDQLQEQVARDMGMTKEELRQKIAAEEALRQEQEIQKAVDALNRQADEFMMMQAVNPGGVDVYETVRDPIGDPKVGLAPIDDYLLDYTGTGSDNLGFQAASDAVDPLSYQLMDQRRRIQQRRENQAMNQLVPEVPYRQSDRVLPNEPTLEDRLRLLQALGL